MISVAVMAHPKREQWIPELVDALGGDVTVVMDEGWNDRHETGLRAMRAYDPTASHHLIVQDDAVPCRDLIAGVGKAVEASGDHPVALYTGSVRPSFRTVSMLTGAAMSAGAPWIAMEGPWWGVGIVLPTAHIDDLSRWYERQSTPNYDRRISRWYARQDIDCWYTAPSLVDHRTEDNPSLVPGRTGQNRSAYWPIGDGSPLDIDWHVPPIVAGTPEVPDIHDVTFRHTSGKTLTVRFGSMRHRKMHESPMWDLAALGRRDG